MTTDTATPKKTRHVPRYKAIAADKDRRIKDLETERSLWRWLAIAFGMFDLAFMLIHQIEKWSQ